MAVVVREFTGTAAELHRIAMPTELDAPEIWVMRPVGLAVAMGSSQRRDQFDTDRMQRDGVQLAERRSGGGAVFIDPVATVWIDVVAPKSSALYSPELAENFLLVGRSWQAALGSLGVHAELGVESGGRTAASSVACWAGLGWGELSVDGAKVVGLSQRRTRWGSRVQAIAVLDGSSARIGDYLTDEGRTVVRGAIPTVRIDIPTDSLEAAAIAALLSSG